MKWFKPRYRIEVKQDRIAASGYCYYLWRNWHGLIKSEYGFETAVEAANAAVAAKEDLTKAWKIANGRK